jgi:hypothetical protein
VKKVLYKPESRMNIIKKKMIGLRTILKFVALICLVNLTYIRAEEATAAAVVENKAEAPVEANTATEATPAKDNNLRFLASCRFMQACSGKWQCCAAYPICNGGGCTN